MKELLLQYARYNVWANKRIIDALLKIDDEEILDQQVESSFPSLRATVYHMWGAEFMWLQRLQLVENPVWMQQIFKGTFAQACEDWQKVSEVMVQFIDRKYDDKALEHVMQYYNSEKKSFKDPEYVAIMQALNNATYHRGQLVTMLRQLNITSIPSTDFITYTRKS